MVPHRDGVKLSCDGREAKSRNNLPGNGGRRGAFVNGCKEYVRGRFPVMPVTAAVAAGIRHTYISPEQEGAPATPVGSRRACQ